MSAAAVPPDWAPRLPSGERVLWAGAPAPRPGRAEAMQGALALLSLGLAALPAWMLLTARPAMTAPELSATGLALALLGFNAAASTRLALRRIRQRPRTRYMVTDARALTCVLEEPPVLADAPLAEIPAPRRAADGRSVAFGRRPPALGLLPAAPPARVVFELASRAEAQTVLDIASRAREEVARPPAPRSGEPRR